MLVVESFTNILAEDAMSMATTQDALNETSKILLAHSVTIPFTQTAAKTSKKMADLQPEKLLQ